MKKHVFLLTLVWFALISLNSQTFNESIYIGDELRSFIVHLPPGAADGTQNLPLILNFHGLNSTGGQQQFYSKMDGAADYFNFIVVYPNSLEGAWDVGLSDSPTDIPFVEKIIDKMYFDYQIDPAKVYSCGMSNGGFFSYRLACEIPERIAAIASVTGSMLISAMNNCTTLNEMPVLQFHGTEDNTVMYDGQPYISPIEDLVAFWAQKNGCDSTFIVEDVPDVSTLDNCTAESITYLNCSKPTILYKINGGGHTWPGAEFVLDAGLTNWDVNATVEIWNFFSQFEIENPIIPQTTDNEEIIENDNFTVSYHNNIITVNSEFPVQNLDIHNAYGQLLYSFKDINQSNFNHFIKEPNSKIVYFRIKIDGHFYTEKGFVF